MYAVVTKLLEKWIEKNGGSVSELIRNLVVGSLSGRKEFKDHKIELLIEQRKKLMQKHLETNKEISKNGDNLIKLGIDLDTI